MMTHRNDGMRDADIFLSEVWRGKPLENGIQLWRKDDLTTFRFAAIAPAAEWVEANQHCDCYVAAGLAARNGTPSRGRAKNNEIVGIGGVWADIDVNGGPENKTDGAPTQDEARDLSEALVQPTLLVCS